jgi:drug/metabolite transporter (DMT)-like permease
MTILLALSAALGWGAADFFGGRARQRTPVFVVLAVSQLIGLAILVPVLVARGVPLPDNPRLLFACLAGLGVTLELRLVYMAISEGDALITAPVGALGAALAVLVGLIGGDRLDLTLAAGMLFALVGGGISAATPEHRGQARGQRPARRRALLCAGAATGLGVALASLHAAGRADPYWAAAIVDVSTFVPAALAGIAREGRALQRRLPGPVQLPALALAAAGGIGGDLAYASASRLGALSIVSALSSLYPLTTITLGVTLQGRRPRPSQLAGVGLALAGAALLGVATH